MMHEKPQTRYHPRKNNPAVLRWLAAVLFMSAGIGHFLRPDFFIPMVPPGFPSPRMLVLMSGLCEIAGGLGLLIQPVRRLAGWGLLALLVAVFPANIYMAIHPERFGTDPWILWARLPFQFVFAAWIWRVALVPPPPKTSD